MKTLYDALAEYVKVRRAFGAQLREPAVTLGHFVAFLESEKAQFITAPLALRWACQSDGVQRATWARRLSMVRRFAAWLSASDPRTEIPPRRLLEGRRRRPKPHIYTDREIEQLMGSMARLDSPTGLRSLTFVTLIGLLVATGLRTGEALALDIDDVDLQKGVLAIRQTKFGKSRFVPVDWSTLAAIKCYAERRDELRPRRQTNAFLVSERGTRLQGCTARRTFARVSRAIGLRSPAEGSRIGRGPRLQDLRHTFVTRKARRLVSSRIRRGTGDAKAGGVPRPRRHRPHLLVHRGGPGVAPTRYRTLHGATARRCAMNSPKFPSLLQRFFTDRLLGQLGASSHTVASYRDTFRLLLRFATEQLRKAPSDLRIEQLDASFLAKFLEHLELGRGNCTRTRNNRLAALHAFFQYVAINEPALALHCQRVLAIPTKRYERGPVEFLNEQESAALVAAPAAETWIGRRDRTILLFALQTGLRNSEITSLRRRDVQLDTGAHVRCVGKGRKARSTPLRPQLVAVLKEWLSEQGGSPGDPLFPSLRGGFLSADALQRTVARHVATASRVHPSLRAKTVTPHTLRHTAAMDLLLHGVDLSVIALWLGHESTQTTQAYVHADMRLKEQALAHATSGGVVPDRYRPSDPLLTFLESL